MNIHLTNSKKIGGKIICLNAFIRGRLLENAKIHNEIPDIIVQLNAQERRINK